MQKVIKIEYVQPRQPLYGYEKHIHILYLSIYLSIYGSTVLWAGDQPCTHRTAQTLNKRTLTSMSQVRFEPTIPVFEREKTINVLDRADTMSVSYTHVE
jgi:hypothetical protein